MTAPPARTFVLRQARVARGFTLEEMAKRAGLALSVYRSLENNELVEWKARTLHCLLRVASLLELSPAELLPYLTEIPDREA